MTEQNKSFNYFRLVLSFYEKPQVVYTGMFACMCTNFQIEILESLTLNALKVKKKDNPTLMF